jgi:O-antigen ligase
MDKRKKQTFSSSSGAFFILLSALLFLGDGKQTVIDSIAAGGILFLFAARALFEKQKPASLSRPIFVAWMILLLFLSVKTVFSDSVGYSITTFVRFIMAYSIFCFFAGAKRGSRHGFFQAGLLFSVFAAIASFIMVIFEDFGKKLPGMNMLYPAYGHNHVAAILMFSIPLAIETFRREKSVKHAIFLATAAGALLCSFARGAILLFVCYAAFCLTARHDSPFRKKSALIGTIIGCVIFLAASFIPRITRLPLTDFIKRQVIKESILKNRLPYWKQSMSAFRARPFFGAGPGTFYLLSKRYQERPANYSWYAHSFPLEILAETGIVGLFLFGLLLLSIVKAVIKKGGERDDGEKKALIDGAALTLLYSLFEFNLNFLVIWLLLWATLGILASQSKNNKGRNAMLRGVLFILGTYYVLSVASSVAGVILHNIQLQATIEPHRADLVTEALDQAVKTKKPPPSGLAHIIYVFHKNNPDVLSALAGQAGASKEKAHGYYRQALTADPQNVRALTNYLFFDVKQIQPDELMRFISFYLKTGDNKQVALRALQDGLMATSEKDFKEFVGNPDTPQETLAKATYFLGYNIVHSSPEEARVLWTLARDLAPQWGYFHVELASLEYHTLHDTLRADEVLKDCRIFTYAARQCKEAIIRDIMPESQYESVKAIPLF